MTFEEPDFVRTVQLTEKYDFLQYDLNDGPTELRGPDGQVIGVLVSQSYWHRSFQLAEDVEDLVAIVEHQEPFGGLAKMLKLLRDGELWGETDLRREFGVRP